MRQGTHKRLGPGASNADEIVPPQAIGRIYRFQDIEVNSLQRSLKKGGEEQYVRHQSFDLLLYFLEQRQRLITKEELVKRFWQDTAVTDNALVQCIADIRKVLGDDSRHPRFIRTIPKVGYRFIAAAEVDERELPHDNPARAQAIDSATEPRGAISPDGDAMEKSAVPVLDKAAAPPDGKLKRRSIQMLTAVATLVLALVVSSLIFHSWRARGLEVTLPPIPGKKRVAVMYFENQSKRADLNWLREGLTDMFIADLAHSDKLTVLSRQQLQLLLERVGHKATSEIRLDEALEVAHRSQADAVMLGSFTAIGERLLVNVLLYESSRGRLIAQDRFVVNRPGDILGQVDLLSLKIAADLGIVASDQRKPSLADVMTKNFEAYRYYSLGVSKAQSFENAEAVNLLKKAVELDPKFAMAYARIGYAYSVTDFLPDKGRPYLEKAFQLSDRLTEKDRLYVTAWYAIARQDYASAIQTLRKIVVEYPQEVEAYARLARLLYREERSKEAISVIQQGLTVDSDDGDLYNVLGICFLGLSRYDDAIAAHERYVQLSPKDPNAHDSLGMSYQQSGRYAEALAEYNAALLLDAKFEPAIIHLGDTYAQLGRYRDAIREYERYIGVTESDAARAVGYGSVAQVYRRRRDFQLAEKAAQQELKYQPGAVWNSLLAALDRGDTHRASYLKERLFENFPYPERGVRHELRSYNYYLGMLALRTDRPAEAISHFKEALRHLPPSSGLDLYEDCLANAYLALGELDNAISEYQRVLRSNPNYFLVEYHLAQAFARKGESEQAQIAYRRFLNLWRGADSDIPELGDAKKAVRQLVAEDRQHRNP